MYCLLLRNRFRENPEWNFELDFALVWIFSEFGLWGGDFGVLHVGGYNI